MQAVEAFSDYGSVAASMVIDQETVEQRRNWKVLLKSALFDKFLTRSSPQNTIFKLQAVVYSNHTWKDRQADYSHLTGDLRQPLHGQLL